MAKHVIAPETPDTDISVTKAQEIRKILSDMQKHFQKGALLAFEAGRAITEVYLRVDYNANFNDWVKDQLRIAPATAARYMEIYDRFKDAPKELADMTINAALGYLKKGSAEPRQVEYGNPDKQQEFDWESCFKKSPVSRIKLKNYRFECPDNRTFYLVPRGCSRPQKLVEFIVADIPDGELKYSYDNMMREVQISLEKYYKEVESIETKGGR